MAKGDLNPFDFMNAASFSKVDLIKDGDNPEIIEKQYNAYIVNRGFTNFEIVYTNYLLYLF